MARPRSGDWNPTDTAAKMRYYRKAMSVGMKLRGKAFSVPEYREYLIYETQRAQRRERLFATDWKWLPEFITLIGLNPDKEIFVGAYGTSPIMRVDLVTVQKAWKRAAAKIHPDRGGDPAKAARLNELWSLYETSMQTDTLKYVPLEERPVVVTKRKKRRKPRTHVTGKAHGFDPPTPSDQLLCSRKTGTIAEAGVVPTCERCYARLAQAAMVQFGKYLTAEERAELKADVGPIVTPEPFTIERKMVDDGDVLVVPETDAEELFVVGAKGVIGWVPVTKPEEHTVPFDRFAKINTYIHPDWDTVKV